MRSHYQGDEVIIGEEKGADGGDLADLDQDGKMDMVIAAEQGNAIAWYQQDSPGSWTEYLISDKVSGVEDVAAGDLDHDGDLDLAYVTDKSSGIVGIAINPGTPTNIPWETQTLLTLANPINTAVADVNGDGYVDIIYAAKVANAYGWLENPRSDILTAAWIDHTIASGPSVAGAYAIRLVDWDGDGDLDILGTARDANAVFWLEKPPNPAGLWTEHEIFSGPPLEDPTDVHYGDLDNDGDLDVAVACRANCSQILWFENHGAAFSAHSVSGLNQIRRPQGVTIYDLDEDGHQEIIGAEYICATPSDNCTTNDAKIFVYEAGNSPTDPWTPHAILNDMVSGDEIFVFDVDGDGTVEIFSTSNDRSFTPAGGRAFYIKLNISAGSIPDSSGAPKVYLPLVHSE